MFMLRSFVMTRRCGSLGVGLGDLVRSVRAAAVHQDQPVVADRFLEGDERPLREAVDECIFVAGPRHH